MAGSLGLVWVAAASICAGVYAGSIAEVAGPAIAAIGAGAGLSLLRRHSLLGLAGVALVCGGLGAIDAQVRLAQSGPLVALARDVARCDVTGTVVEPAGGLGLLVEITHARCLGWSGTGLGLAAIDADGPAGARFTATGWFVPLRDDHFDTARRRMGAQVSLYASDFAVVAGPRAAHAVAERVRSGLRRAVADLEPTRAALLEGLTIGETSGLPPEVTDRFRSSGLSHVLAVSGSNVAIVLGAVAVCLRWASLRLRIALAYAALGLFVLVVGPDASVLRAGVMGAIALGCIAGGRTAEPLAALGLAVIVVVALRPGMVFSAGMQLSVAATAGIIVFSDPIARRLSWMPGLARMMIAATLAAQVAVAPLLVLIFGELSVIAPVANALALPAVAPATVAGLAAGVIAIAAPGAARLLAAVVSPAAAWVLFVAGRLGGQSWSLVGLPSWMGWVMLVVVCSWAARVLGGGPRDLAG